MGTRALTHILDDDGVTLVTIYRQMDGYPSEHGADLVAILRDRRIRNGIGGTADYPMSNGMGCLAATIVATLKAAAGEGGIYLMPPGSTDHDEEYVYTVTLAPDSPGSRTGRTNLRCDAITWDGPNVTLHDGPPESFDTTREG